MVVEDIDCDENSLDKEFMDFTQLINDEIDSIETSPRMNNDNFLQSSWGNL